jgi:hypothetical protein
MSDTQEKYKVATRVKKRTLHFLPHLDTSEHSVVGLGGVHGFGDEVLQILQKKKQGGVQLGS